MSGHVRSAGSALARDGARAARRTQGFGARAAWRAGLPLEPLTFSRSGTMADSHNCSLLLSSPKDRPTPNSWCRTNIPLRSGFIIHKCTAIVCEAVETTSKSPRPAS
eukprot:scaffold89477_cov27-Tisochrysis_lutea.AAC.5